MNSTYNVSLVNAVKIELTRLQQQKSVRISVVQKCFSVLFFQTIISQYFSQICQFCSLLSHFCLRCPRCPIRHLRCPSSSCPCHCPAGENGSEILVLRYWGKKGGVCPERCLSSAVDNKHQGSVHDVLRRGPKREILDTICCFKYLWFVSKPKNRLSNCHKIFCIPKNKYYFFLQVSSCLQKLPILAERGGGWVDGMVQERGCHGGNQSKRWRNISARGRQRFLQELEKYFYKRWRNISARDGEILLNAYRGKHASCPSASCNYPKCSFAYFDKITATFGLQGGHPHNFDLMD